MDVVSVFVWTLLRNNERGQLFHRGKEKKVLPNFEGKPFNMNKLFLRIKYWKIPLIHKKCVASKVKFQLGTKRHLASKVKDLTTLCLVA